MSTVKTLIKLSEQMKIWKRYVRTNRSTSYSLISLLSFSTLGSFTSFVELRNGKPARRSEMGNRFRVRERGNDRETARKEKEAVGKRVILRWRPLQLRELTSNEKSRPRRNELGRRCFLKADRVDGKVFRFAYNLRKGDKRKRREVCNPLNLPKLYILLFS